MSELGHFAEGDLMQTPAIHLAPHPKARALGLQRKATEPPESGSTHVFLSTQAFFPDPSSFLETHARPLLTKVALFEALDWLGPEHWPLHSAIGTIVPGPLNCSFSRELSKGPQNL